MKTVMRANKQLRIPDDQLESVEKLGYVEVDEKTGKPLHAPARDADAAALKKENAALKKENKDLRAQVEALTPKD